MNFNVFDGYKDFDFQWWLLKTKLQLEEKDMYFKILKKTFGNKTEELPTLKEIEIIERHSFNNFIFKSMYNMNSFTVLNHEFLLKIIEIIIKNKIKKVVELGSGTSVFSKWLNVYLKKENVDVDIIAVDKHEEDYFDVKNLFFETKNYDAIEYMNKYQEKDTLYILGWPSYDTSFAYNVLKNLKFNNRILYIGEQEGGCTANDNFFELLNNYKIKNIYKVYKSFSTIYDQPYLISKQKNKEV